MRLHDDRTGSESTRSLADDGVAPGKRTLVQRMARGRQPSGAPSPSPAPDAGASGGHDLGRLLDETVGFFAGSGGAGAAAAPVQRKAAGDAAGDAAARHATGGVTVIQVTPDGERSQVLIGKGEAHGVQVGQHVSFGSAYGVRLIGRVIRVFPHRATVSIRVESGHLGYRRRATFVDHGPLTPAGAVDAAHRARVAERRAERRRAAAAPTATPDAGRAPDPKPDRGDGDDDGDRDGETPAAGRAHAAPEVVVTDALGHAFRDADRNSLVRVDVRYTVGGKPDHLQLILHANHWWGRASREVREDLGAAGLDPPPRAAVNTLMRAIRRAMRDAHQASRESM